MNAEKVKTTRYYVYLAECSDGTYYCGYTTDLRTRLEAHNTSKDGAKYTRSRRPVKLVYADEVQTKSEALKRELEIKGMSRRGKEGLVRRQRNPTLNK